LKADTRAISKASSQIPYTTEQGIISAEKGIPAQEQEIFTDQIRNRCQMMFSAEKTAG
jgi:hypothetical protein